MFSILGAITDSAKSIGQGIGARAKDIQTKFKSYAYAHDPNPLLYVVSTLDEMINYVKQSVSSREIKDDAHKVLNDIFSCFNAYDYINTKLNYRKKPYADDEMLLNELMVHHNDNLHKLGSEDRVDPKVLLPLGQILQHYWGHNHYALVPELLPFRQGILSILLSEPSFRTFCENIEPHQFIRDYRGSQHYLNPGMRFFKVAFLMHGGNVESFMNALVVDHGPYDKDRRPIKSWLSTFFSKETASVFQNPNQLQGPLQKLKIPLPQLPLNQFSDYPKRIAALVFLPQIPDVPGQQYDGDVRKIRYFYSLIRQNEYDCHVCLENFINAKIMPDGYDLGIQCPDKTCHEAHPLCQGCVEQIKKTNMENNMGDNMLCPSCKRRLIEPMPNLIPAYLRQLNQIKQKLDEASEAHAQFPRHECDGLLHDATLYPQFMLTACDRFKKVKHMDTRRLERQVDELLEQLNKIQDGMKGIMIKRERGRSRSPNRGGARKRTTRVPRKQRKQCKQRKSRKQRK